MKHSAVLTGALFLSLGAVACTQPTPNVIEPDLAPQVIEPDPGLTQIRTAETTMTYWSTWKHLRDRYSRDVEPYAESYSVDNSQALAALNAQMAEGLGQQSAVAVDADLVAVAAEAVVAYRTRAQLFQQQAGLLQSWNAFEQKRDSSEKVAETVLVFLFNESDRLAVPKALAQEASALSAQWQDNEAQIAQVDQRIQAMSAQRDALKLQLEARYGVVFEQ
ncbi:MAG: hypothetical protein WBG32_06490 [Nodosilinea sp.]